VMAVRQTGERTQIAVLEDDVLVEHYVTRARSTSYVGNVYLGRVQNVLPSMEAAFVDIGKGRNGVLYAGEVNWDAAGLEGKSRAIENAMKSGDTVLVQVTKDPFGHKGARLTSQVSLPGRFLVYVPGGGMTGISRRLPDTERHRLKSILKKIVPEDAGVIVRTAAEGATEEELTLDVDRLKAEWETISKKAAQPKNAPALVHGEPDLAIRVVRDVFNEDFKKLIVQGDEAWKTVSDYVDGVAPDLRERVSKYTGAGDLFADLRVDEGLAKALDRKVWLPSGGSLVIDRTEAMTVIDVNTGKFVGAGGNLEQTVTRNNLEAAEEIVRQLRLRDVGGIVVIDFIDMVLESNRELVLRRLTECLGRDRTKHQVAEVTSLGLVQMTRKRVGEGLLEAFSDTCEVCHGRGVIIHSEPVDRSGSGGSEDDEPVNAKPRRKRGGAKQAPEAAEEAPLSPEQREKALAAMAAIHRAAHPDLDAADASTIADLEMDAVQTLLAGSAIDSELLDAPREPEEPTGSEPPESQESPDSAPAPASSEASPDDQPGEPVEDAAQEPVLAPVKAARPRRRSAASRPAGPPAAT
jgi:ribonuclease E